VGCVRRQPPVHPDSVLPHSNFRGQEFFSISSYLEDAHRYGIQLKPFPPYDFAPLLIPGLQSLSPRYSTAGKSSASAFADKVHLRLQFQGLSDVRLFSARHTGFLPCSSLRSDSYVIFYYPTEVPNPTGLRLEHRASSLGLVAVLRSAVPRE